MHPPGPPPPPPPPRPHVPLAAPEDHTSVALDETSTGPPVPAEAGPAEAGPALLAGRTVDGYEVVRRLGEGGMGAVYLARDVGLGRPAVLKIVRPGAPLTPELTQRLLFEARVTARFSHPHIVTIYGVGSVDGWPYVAMEYLRGETLRERLRRERPTLGEALRLARAIADALAEAHRHGVLHRDLKPANVFLSRDGRLRVLDFGLAKLVTPADGPPGPGGLPTSGDAFDEGAPLGADGTDGFLRPTVEHTAPGAVAGTLRYMAPEQWRAHPLTPAVDVWAFGIVLFELLTGRLPYPGSEWASVAVPVCAAAPAPRVDDLDPDLPRPVADLVARCLEKDPAERPTAAQVLLDLQRLAAPEREDAPEAGERNPFRGLLPFRRADADAFFGRDAEVGAFLERLRTQPFVPVVGASGAGKSSFLLAGVVPALESLGGWRVFVTRPGDHPFRSLAASLLAPDQTSDERRGAVRSAVLTAQIVAGLVEEDGSGLPERLARTPGALAALLRSDAQAHARDGTTPRVLIVVDQFEELWTLTPDPALRAAFADALCAAADDPDGTLRVAFTLRDDFLGRLAEHEGLAAALSAGLFVLRTPAAGALVETLIRPVQDRGHAWEDEALPPAMVAEVADEPGGLPLLQFAAARLWDARDRRRRLLLRSVYEEMGGVAGALADHADGILDELGPRGAGLARALLLRLVTAAGTRRPVARGDLLAGLEPGAGVVLDRMLAARLLVTRRPRGGDGGGADGGADADGLVTLAHEALVVRWERLRRWRAEERDDLAYRERLTAAAADWERRGRPPGLLWGGAERQRALAWWSERDEPLPPSETAFLRALRARQRRRRRTLTASVVGIVALALLVAAGALVALGRIEAAREEAEARQIEAQDARAAADERAREARDAAAAARANLAEALYEKALGAEEDGDRQTAEVLLAAALGQSDHAAARGRLHTLRQRPDRPRLRWREAAKGAATAAFSPDGRWLAIGREDGRIALHDPGTGALVRALGSHGGPVVALEFAADGRMVVSGGPRGPARLWDCTGAGAHRELGPAAEGSRAVALSRDGRTLVTGGDDGSVRLWDVTTGRERWRVAGHEGEVRAVALSTVGDLVLSAGEDRTVRLWRAEDGVPAGRAPDHDGRVKSAEFAPDGRRFATAGGVDVRLFDVAPLLVEGAFPPPPVRLTGHRYWVCGLSFFADGRRLASGGFDRTVRVWDLESGSSIARLGGYEEPICEVAVSPDGALLAVVDPGSGTHLWELHPPAPGVHLPPHAAEANAVAWSPDGASLATADLDASVHVWDAATGAALRTLALPAPADVPPSPPGGAGAAPDPALLQLFTGEREVALAPGERWVASVTWAPDGRSVAAAGGLGVTRWEAATGRLLPAPDTEGPAWSLAWSPDGGRLLVGGFRQVRLHDARDGRLLARTTAPGDWVWSVTFAPDGGSAAFACADGALRLWRPGDDAAPTALWAGEKAVNSVAFAGTDRLVFGGDDGVAHVWDLARGSERFALTAPCRGLDMLAVSRDGALLATACADGSAHVWDLASGRARVRLDAHEEPAMAVAFAPDGTLLATAGWDRAVRLWDLPELLAPGEALLATVTRETGLVLHGVRPVLAGAPASPAGPVPPAP